MKLAVAFTIDSVSFSAGVIAGAQSLGGSESACLGLARALQARGHDVHIFTTQLGADAPAVDHAGVSWHHTKELAQYALLKDWDVLVALRMPGTLEGTQAKFKVLWCQDLMSGDGMKQYVMGSAWAYDAVAYVSEFHRKQWEGVAPELAPIGYTTRNGFDVTLAPTSAVSKNPNRIIHISRPERGLEPLLAMWPKLRALEPDAELALCRYSSMYDPQGWGQVCQSYDEEVARVNAAVGGITWLGELGKPELYKAIAESAVMWYPGVVDFGETSCIAAVESQACGTPFVGSFKGALPETAPGAVLIKGDALKDEAYHDASIAAVREMLAGCRKQTFAYRSLQQHGRKHVQSYTYDAIAAEWEQWLLDAFTARYEAQKPQVLARLIHEDDLVAAKIVAEELGDADAIALCERVFRGLDHTADTYAARALDPIDELKTAGGRMSAVVRSLVGAKKVLDVACGNGSFALALAMNDEARRVTAVDYSQANIDAGRKAAESLGLADRIEFICAPVWDFATGQPSAWLKQFTEAHAESFDGLWCGEFIEHIADCTGLVNALEALTVPGAQVVWTCPFGPMTQLAGRETPLARSHVHHFRAADIEAVFGGKPGIDVGAAAWNALTGAGETVGQWVIRYQRGPLGDTGTRPLERRTLIRPKSRITAGLIVNDTLDLRRCLDSVWPVVDEIILGNCGVADAELEAVAAEFPRKTRILHIGDVSALPGGFSEARNRVLADATGEWFMWVDADERLVGGMDIGKYVDGAVFNGYSIRQQHLYLDVPTSFDTPVRLFRRTPDVQFYGCVHEQPQYQHANGDIVPCLQLNDACFAHTGYLHENIRRDKALRRNLPLLVRDQQVFPERELGKVLVLRDYANLALWEREKAQTANAPLSDAAKHYYANVVALFEQHFMAPSHRFHAIGRPFYEQALPFVSGAIEVEMGLVGQPGGLGRTHAKAERRWFRKPSHVRDYLLAQADAMLAPLETPFAMDVEPIGRIAAPVEDATGVPA